MTIVSITLDELIKIPVQCAWKGCEQSCPSSAVAPLPEGWLCLITFHELANPGVLDFARDRVQRDAVLCPQHVRALEALLKPI